MRCDVNDDGDHDDDDGDADEEAGSEADNEGDSAVDDARCTNDDTVAVANAVVMTPSLEMREEMMHGEDSESRMCRMALER